MATTPDDNESDAPDEMTVEDKSESDESIVVDERFVLK